MQSNTNEAQKRYNTQEQTSSILDSVDTTYITGQIASFIERCSYFFLATASKEGIPNVNYKGGEKGFVHVLDKNTLLFPDIQGNGIFHGINDMIENPNIGMLFIDFITGHRFKVNGVVTIVDNKEEITSYFNLVGFDYPPRVIRVDVKYVMGNCSKNIDNVRREIIEYSGSVK